MYDPQSTFPVGFLIRRQFVVVEVLGRSEFGAVYLVRDKRSSYKRYVIKEVVLSVFKEQSRYPFNVTNAKRLSHPSLPRIYQGFYSERHDRIYFLTDYIEGRNLQLIQQKLPEKRASLPEAFTIVSPIVDAVNYLHRQHPALIHGDIKPSNIIMPTSGASPVLVDFGSFMILSPSTSASQKEVNYRAPEQYSMSVSVRSDIYALGAILYTLLTGTIPVSASDRLTRLGEKKPDPLVEVNQIIPSISATISETINQAMLIDSQDRFSTVDQFWDALWCPVPAKMVLPHLPCSTMQQIEAPVGVITQSFLAHTSSP